MNKFVVIVFPAEAEAYEGTRVLNALHEEGSLTLYGMAVIAKDASGSISTKELSYAAPLGTAAGALVGGLIGLIGGTPGALAGAAGGALIGSLRNLFDYGVGEEFLSRVSTELTPGKTAVVAELAERWTMPLDTRMEALGAKILRTWRVDFEDQLIEREIAARRAEFEQLTAEHAQATAEGKARLKTKMDQAKADLGKAEARAKAKLKELENETHKKVETLGKQLKDVGDDARQEIGLRIAVLRADYQKRAAKLKQAWELTKEALAA